MELPIFSSFTQGLLCFGQQSVTNATPLKKKNYSTGRCFCNPIPPNATQWLPYSGRRVWEKGASSGRLPQVLLIQMVARLIRRVVTLPQVLLIQMVSWLIWIVHSNTTSVQKRLRRIVFNWQFLFNSVILLQCNVIGARLKKCLKKWESGQSLFSQQQKRLPR